MLLDGILSQRNVVDFVLLIRKFVVHDLWPKINVSSSCYPGWNCGPSLRRVG